MTALEIPKFAEILGEPLSSVPEASRPGFLARLERAAAGRYREWAEQDAENRAGLLACAAREDEIADRIEKLMPVRHEDESVARAAFERARSLYAAVFEGRSLRECMILQAHAEREGALAWQAFAGQISAEAARRELAALSELEIANADFIDGALGIRSTGRS